MLSGGSFFTKLAQKHPALSFIVITYLWSWSFWIPIHIGALPPGMPLALTLLGVFGPALAGCIVLRLREGAWSEKATLNSGFLVGAVLAAAALAMLQVNLLGVTDLAPKDNLTFPTHSPWYVYGLMALVITLSGFVFSNVQNSHASIRAFYKGLVPTRRTLILAVPVLFFLPTLLIGANVIGEALGIPAEQPTYQQQAVAVWLPLMFVKLFTVAILTGGNEEHGWRGVLLPLLQQRWSPLKATLLIALVWEPWHLPFVLDTIEGNANMVPLLIARLVMILPITFLMTLLYNYSRGSTFLCILLHACFNTQYKLFVGSPLMMPLLFLTVIALVISMKMWRRGSGYAPTARAEG